VRVLETKAREAGQRAQPPASTTPRRAAGPRVHPDQAAAAHDIADALSTALGHDVYVHPHGDGYRAELRLDSLDEALELARSIRG
jgi:ParB family chromosome partitioning protein